MKKAFFAILLSTIFLASCKKKEDDGTRTKNGIALSSQAVVPAVSSSATGSVDAMYMLAGNMFHYTINWSALSSAPIGIHLHGPASAGTNAAILYSFTGYLSTTSGSITGIIYLDVNALKATELIDGKWYVDIHTTNNSSGELRGQIVF
jgi:hypothetical protein